MNAILVYDINVERVQKVLKICRKYLNHVQNSVFEGEISEAKLEKLKLELKNVINIEKDSIIIYTFRTNWYSRREIIGVEKGKEELVL